jgi:hypothetical protein
MVSWLNLSLIGLFLFAVVIVQGEPLVKTSNDIEKNKSPISNQQLYELYKTMRTDPRFASVPNNDLVLYIYRNFVLGNGDDTDYAQLKNQKHRRHRHQKAVLAE